MSTDTSQKIIDEMIELAVDVIKTVNNLKLPKSVVEQITKSITSIGANFSEAQDSSSKKDFINKIYIAKKEANESIYWLKLCSKLTNEKTNLSELQQRTQRYLMMLQKIINSSKVSKIENR